MTPRELRKTSKYWAFNDVDFFDPCTFFASKFLSKNDKFSQKFFLKNDEILTQNFSQK